MGKRLATLVLACGLVLGAALLVVRAGALNTLSHDDAISYLAATGHMGAYAADIPAGRWVPAQAWQSYWTPDRFAIFRQIGSDLAHYDIHPPLYFWLLHLWIGLTGVRLSAGPTLNVIFLLLGAWAIFLACRLARSSRGAGVLAAVTWLLSGATLSVGGETRQYGLLGLAVAGLAASLLFFLKRRSRGAAFVVYGVASAGLLVHYQFALVLALAVLTAALLLARGRAGRGVAYLAIAVAAAGITFVLLHPEFMASFAMQREFAAPLVWREAPYRLTRVLDALLELVMPARLAHGVSSIVARYWELSLLLALAAGLGVWLAVRSRLRAGPASLADGAAFVLVFSAAGSLAIIGLYVFQFSPRHAMGAQYLMAVSPLLFMAGAQVFDRLTGGLRWRTALLVALLVYQAIYGGWATRAQVRSAAAERRTARDSQVWGVASGGPILLDSVARGVLPTVLWHAAGSTPVYAAMQDDLLRDFPVIPEDTPSLVYVSDLRDGNDADKRGRVLARLAQQGYRTVERKGSVFGVGQVYVVTR